MRLVALFSGGKDSTYALHVATQAGHEVVALLSMLPQNPDSFLFHTPNMEWTSLQARSMKIPLIRIPTSGEKTREYEDLLRALRELKNQIKFDGVITGAVYSTYQSSRIQKICHEIGVACYNPLWQTLPQAHWHELLVNGFEIMLVSVAAQGLDHQWLGRTIAQNDIPALAALEKKHGVSPIGEGGEYESFVLDAPLFHKKLIVKKWKDSWKGLQGTRHISEIVTEKKRDD